MSRLPPLAPLRAFEACSRLLNMRLAADELGVTHGAIAQQIRALEAVLGVNLFKRTPRGLSLTFAGQLFQAPIQRAFTLIADATAAVRADEQRRRLGITVTTTPSLAAKWLIPRLGSFSEHEPEVEVRILASERIESLGEPGGPDIAIRYSKPPFPFGLEAQQIMRVALLPVCSPSIAATITNNEDLATATLLHDGHMHWPRWLEKAGIVRTAGRDRRFSQTALAIDAALIGLGVALAPAPLVEEDLESGRLTTPVGRNLDFFADRSFYLVSAKSALQRDGVRSFRDWLLNLSR
jgi:LysR family glycine cleavage system transcriptional activator